MGTLPLKLILAPTMVTGVSLAGRRWGPAVAGSLGGLPIVGGPILLLIALDQGAAFGARAAVATDLGLVGTIAFALVYAWSARAARWPVSLGLGWLTFALSTIALRDVAIGPSGGAAIAIAAVTCALLALPRGHASGMPAPAPWWDLPLRAAATGSLVFAVTTMADAIGPRWSGLLAPFPIATSVLAAFTHAQLGPAACARLLRGLIAGLYSFVAFTTVVASTIEPRGIAAGFVAAVAAALALNGVLTLATIRRAR